MQRVTLISLLIATFVVTPAVGEISPDRIQRLDQYLDDEAVRFHLPGLAVAVVEGGKIVHTKCWGDDVRQDSAFLIGSCSKTITALAALLAFSDAGVDLDTPINTLLTNLTIRGEVTPPTPRQLLQHRSGLTRDQGFDSLPSLAEIEESGLTLKLKFPPGARFNYSNRNYALLGLLIEKVTGQSFCDFVQERVFKPAGMTQSTCGSIASEDVAPEHQYFFGFARRVAKTRADAAQIPAGFLRCSAHDLARLQICLLRDGKLEGQQIFPAKLIQQMKTPAGDAEFGYGMGLANGRLDGLGPVIAHEGATPTGYAFHGALTERELGIVLLININLFDPFTDHGETIYKNMLRILDGQPPVASHPYRIWVRWALIPIIFYTLWQTAKLLALWRRAGWPFVRPRSLSHWLSLILSQLVLPVAIWILVLRWVEVRFLDALRLDPDIMWTFVFLTATGMVTGVIKKCGGEGLKTNSTPQSPYPPPSSPLP